MTTPHPAGEVTGLDQSIAYAQQVALLAGEHAPAGNEGYLAHLARSHVDGAGLVTARQMQDAFATAQAAATQHATVLAEQKTVQAAYDQNPDAGDKDYQQAHQATDPTGAVVSQQSASASNPPPRKREGATDPLRLATRIVLQDGDQFAGSASVKDEEGTLVLLAAVDTPAGRQVHIAVPIDEEDRKSWRGGNALAEETEIDEEDGEEYHVYTGAEVTAVVDAAAAARMPEVCDDVVAKATEVDKEYRKLARTSQRLYDERGRLEARRFGSEGEGERKISVDWQVRHEEQLQRDRRREMDDAADRLDAEDRARYDELQQQIDAAGHDTWEPGKEAEAAAVLDLTPEELQELQALKRISYRLRTGDQHDRYKQLDPDRRHHLPPLLAEQAALVCGLTMDEFREMEALERIPKPHRVEYYNRRRRVRTAQEQARLDELDNSPRGATGADRRQTYRLRARFLSATRVHLSARTNVADARAEQAAMDAVARPLESAEAAELERIAAELAAVDARLEELGGYASATAQIPARNGGSVVIEAIQQEEEGGVRYRMERKPADADDDWSTGSTLDPFSTNAAGLRKVAKLAATLAGSMR